MVGDKKSLGTARNKVGQTETLTRAMLGSLKNVEVLPGDEARALLREGMSEQEALALDSAHPETDSAEDPDPEASRGVR